MSKVYVPVSPNTELPPEGKWVFIFTKQHGELLGKQHLGQWKAIFGDGRKSVEPEDIVTHWLKEVELPTDDEVRLIAWKYPQINAAGFMAGSQHILNLFKKT